MRVLPVRFTVLRMMAAVAVVAVVASALRHAELATSLLILAASTFAVRSLFAGPVGRRSRRWAIPYLVTLACLYLPLVWVVWYHPWEGPRWAGVEFWPVFPGLFAGWFANRFLFAYYPDERTIALVMAAGAIFHIAVFTWLGSLGRVAMVMSNFIASIGSICESLIAYQLFEQMQGTTPFRTFPVDAQYELSVGFMLAPSSAVLSVGFMLSVGHLWKRMRPRKPDLAPRGPGIGL